MNMLSKDTDPRMREIMGSLVKHLHDFARETNLTHDEWRVGLDFLEWAGKITTPERNEFVLLSDVMGLSSLVDMIATDGGDALGMKISKNGGLTRCRRMRDIALAAGGPADGLPPGPDGLP